jgi:serine/threonine protein kinase
MERSSRVSELPQPDERWLDRYEIRRELGRGGFGRVYLAYDLRLDREVAIKVLQQAEDLTEMDYQRFRREINIAASLSHPGVVTVYDGGDHEGLSYLVMRYVEGRDLRHELRDGPLPTTRLLSVIDQIASALDYAHGRGLVHRDVKPANILCEASSDRVYLADFGISRRVDQSTGEQLTQSDLGPATFYYAAPEQLQAGHRIDARTDVYAFGCVLYECLTGHRPFDGDIGAVLGAHLHAAPPRVTDVRPDLSPRWDDIVARAMAKSPEQRFQHCGQVSDAVDALAPAARTPDDERDFAPTMVAPPSVRETASDHDRDAPERTRRVEEVRREGPQPRRVDPRLRRERASPARTRWAVAGLVTALLALAGAVFWPQLSSAIENVTDRTQVAGEQQRGAPTLDGEQQDLLAAVGVFEPRDCRPSTGRIFDGQREAIACSSDAQSPTGVAYRQFDDEATRDAAFDALASGPREGADCRFSDVATHRYRGRQGDGRVVCKVARGQAGMTWTVPGQPILGSARIDDSDTLDDLYTWWDGMVERDAGDRLPNCPVDDGLIERGATTAVQCQMTGGVATVASHAQFADLAAMDQWYDGVVTNAREERLRQVLDGDDPAACRRLGAGRRRWTGADVAWTSQDARGRLLCFVNETDQNALFWTNEATGVGSVAVSPAGDATLRAMIDEWLRSPYRLAN